MDKILKYNEEDLKATWAVPELLRRSVSKQRRASEKKAAE